MTHKQMKKTLFFVALAAAFTFTACSENGTENTQATTAQQQEMAHGDLAQEQMSTEVVVETPDYTHVAEPLKTQVSELVDAYLQLKDALVASDAGAAQTAAQNVVTIAQAMPVATLTTDEKAYAEEKTAAVVNSATQIAAAGGLEAQRRHLEPLAESVFAMAKAFDATDQTLYYQHCPMAHNDQGAYWLSTNEEIRNPYFGESMLKCGSTAEVYKQ